MASDNNIEHQLSVITSGTVQVVPQRELADKLAQGRPLNIKLGVDPTAPDIHLGHAVALQKLRQFQQLGHNVILIIGDGTALIGDPTGRNTTRPQLSREQIEENAQTYIDQAMKVLDADKTTIVRNADWILSLGMEKLLGLMAQFTVARILDRDDFHNRYEGGQPISLHEFMYPVMQAYDSVIVKADVEIGGTDQLFNLLAGRELMEKMGLEPQVCITLPLLEGTDGVRKMSKTYGNYIALSEPPEDMFGKVMSIPDELMVKYFTLASSVNPDDIAEIESGLSSGELHPNAVKRELARNITAMYHDEETALMAEARFDKVCKDKSAPDDIAEYEGVVNVNDDGTVYLCALLRDIGFADTTSAARRLIDGGGVSINGEKVAKGDYNVAAGELAGAVVKAGKLRFIRMPKNIA